MVAVCCNVAEEDFCAGERCNVGGDFSVVDSCDVEGDFSAERRCNVEGEDFSAFVIVM